MLIVLVSEQAAHPRLHAQGPEEIPRDILAITRVHRRLRSRSADARRRVAGLQCCEIDELRGALPACDHAKR